ncbi:MAG: ATP-binding protein [Chloroflexi bacterium]|nr:ATP-binding protein [Chloroflexota bacterium]
MVVGLVDRERQLAVLRRLWEKDGPALALVYGRRRVGKTYFLKTFLKAHRGVYFLAADSTSEENLAEMLDQIRSAFPDRQDVVLQNYPSWRMAFRLLCNLARSDPLLVVLDEFSYLAHADSSVPSVLQAVWDQDAQGSHVKLVLCGSELGMLSSLGDYGAPLHGRFDWTEQYKPLDYYDAGRFLDAATPGARGYSHRDKLTAYGLYGGSGRYLAQIEPGRPLAANVASHLLDPSGIFHREGEILIRQERDIRDAAGYNAVLAAIAAGATDWAEIANQSHVDPKGLSNYLTRLQQLGWITQETPFGEHGRRSIYRLADNMRKAWYRYVFRHRSALEIIDPEDAWRTLVEPDLPDYMGQLVLEEVARQHLARFAARYGLPMVMGMGRWWSRKHEVEIDVVAEIHDGSYLFGEVKWASSPVPLGELFKLQRKVDAVPHQAWKRNARYALFSAGGFEEKLILAARDQGVLLVGARDLYA